MSVLRASTNCVQEEQVGSIRLFLEDMSASKSPMIGVIIVLGVFLLVTCGPFVHGYSPTKLNIPDALHPPSLKHWFGTDSLGRDVFTRVLYGTRTSIVISFVGVFLGLTIGGLLGLLSGYYGGVLDDILMRGTDLLLAFPSYVLAVFLLVVLGYGMLNLMCAIGLIYVPIFARLMRGLTRMIRAEQFVQANRSLGMNDWQIMFAEILPNATGPLIVQGTIGVAAAVILEAGLSFLGLGVQPPTVSLGIILADGKDFLGRAPWVVSITGVFVSVMLLGFNLFGDGVRDYLDPKLARGIGGQGVR
jgi:peptide/nickel transport system permease protein